MGFNYASEVVKWRNWKKQEESILRSFGVDENIIQQLHDYDWEVFKRERSIKRRQSPTSDSFFHAIPCYDKKELHTIYDLRHACASLLFQCGIPLKEI